MVPENLESFDVAWVTSGDAFHEADFDVQIANLFAVQPFALSTAFLGHTTVAILSKWSKQVKCRKGSWEVNLSDKP